MGLDYSYIGGQTPLDEEEKEGLLLPIITTRRDLNELEQHNIEEAVSWMRARKYDVAEIASEQFVRELHRRMFASVWKWAGAYRNSNKNIGVDKTLIPVQLREMLNDLSFWIEHKTYGNDEIAVRASHRIVWIHCFANGNGRHSRLFADIICTKVFGNKVFTWGSDDVNQEGNVRERYLDALRKADDGNIAPLLRFARE